MKDISHLDIDKLRERSLEQHRDFLEDWRNSAVPPELVVVYLSIVGAGHKGLTEYRRSWEQHAHLHMKDELAALAGVRRPRSVVLLKKVSGTDTDISGVALSGDPVRVPVKEGGGGILVNGTSRVFRQEGGQERTIIVVGGTSDHRLHVPVQVLARARVGTASDLSQIFREFVETVARDCFLDRQIPVELTMALGRATSVGQTTVKDTRRLLWEYLPRLLEELRLPEGSEASTQLRKYHTEEMKEIRRRNGSGWSSLRVAKLKDDLWTSMANYAPTILCCVRHRIEDQGYSSIRVLFELFQNAHDAYVQYHTSDSEPACFRVEVDKRVLRIIHWGRPINSAGGNEDEEQHGYGRDLLNMLVMHASEKRIAHGVAGRFGLGFKCVHLLSDSVGIASGYVALRTIGGLLVEPWEEGLGESRRRSGPGRVATLIEVPYEEDMERSVESAVQEFRNAMAWLLAFSRSVSRIEIVVHGAESTIEFCVVRSWPGADRMRSIEGGCH